MWWLHVRPAAVNAIDVWPLKKLPRASFCLQRWSASATGVSDKRYRYTGKEKDEETGLYYHGARYYAPWLGRWTAADPSGLVDGANLYAYVSGNPIALMDPDGRQPTPPPAGRYDGYKPGPGPGMSRPTHASTSTRDNALAGVGVDIAAAIGGSFMLMASGAAPLLFLTGCGDSGCAAPPDKSAGFLDKAVSLKDSALRTEPLGRIKTSKPTIDRVSENAKDPEAGKYEDGGITVSGALADTINNYASNIVQGKASGTEIGQFSRSMGVLYHEGFHLGFASLSRRKRPSWYAAEQDRYKSASNKEGSRPVLAEDREEVVDEALGGYVQGSVTAYLDIYGKLAAQKRTGTANPASIATLRKEYTAAVAANRAKTHGYWRVPELRGSPELGDRHVKNTTVKLSATMRAYADRFTGLTGDFDKDFSRQLMVPKR